MAIRRAALTVISTGYFVLTLAFWLGWQVVTDRWMDRDRQRVAEQLQANGIQPSQARAIVEGVGYAYANATS